MPNSSMCATRQLEEYREGFPDSNEHQQSVRHVVAGSVDQASARAIVRELGSDIGSYRAAHHCAVSLRTRPQSALPTTFDDLAYNPRLTPRTRPRARWRHMIAIYSPKDEFAQGKRR